MLMLFKIAMTISIVWFVASLVGLSLRFKREETKFPDGSRRFFDGRTRRLRVGCWAIGALTHFIFLDCGTISASMLWRGSSRGRPIHAPATFIHPCQPTVAKQPPWGLAGRMS